MFRSFAREIAEGLATAVVVASEDRRVAFDFRDLLASESFRVFTSADVVGLEVGGAVKNVLALAAGAYLYPKPTGIQIMRLCCRRAATHQHRYV